MARTNFGDPKIFGALSGHAPRLPSSTAQEYTLDYPFVFMESSKYHAITFTIMKNTDHLE